MLNSPDIGPAPGVGSQPPQPGSGGEQDLEAPPAEAGYVNVTPQEKEAIERVRVGIVVSAHSCFSSDSKYF